MARAKNPMYYKVWINNYYCIETLTCVDLNSNSIIDRNEKKKKKKK